MPLWIQCFSGYNVAQLNGAVKHRRHPARQGGCSASALQEQRAGGPVERSAGGSEHPKGVEHPSPEREVSPAWVPPPPPRVPVLGGAESPGGAGGFRGPPAVVPPGPCHPSAHAPAVSQPRFCFLQLALRGPAGPMGLTGRPGPMVSPSSRRGARGEGRPPQFPTLESPHSLQRGEDSL